MSKSFLPSRWWEWMGVLFLILLLAAMLFPLTSYSGPGISHGRVARDMANRYRLTSRWPVDEEDYQLTRVPRFHSYAYHLQGAFVDPKLPEPFVHAAIYRIEVDGKTELWRVNQTGRPQRLAKQ